MDPDVRRQNGSEKIQRGQGKLWRRCILVLSCLAALGTAYALIRPAITLSDTAFCGMEEHTHGESCWEQRLVCTWEPPQSEEPHVHGDGCWETQQVLCCTIPENHVHDENCHITPLLCGLEEGEKHTHTEQCFGEPELSCTVEENHVHSEDCYTQEEVLICDMEEASGILEEEPHVHTEQCYETVLVCGMEEHTHSLFCYADSQADLETPELWRQSLPELTGNWASDLLAVARSQLGYAESSRNYIVDDAGSVKGYTRYGAWTGNPYGDWNVAFAAFCLRYANIPAAAVPSDGSCANWLAMLGAADGVSAGPGDLVFLDGDGDSTADRVGILAGIADGCVNTIEGDWEGTVSAGQYALGDAAIVGFGKIPANPELGKYTCGRLAHVHEPSCYDGGGALQCGFEAHSHTESCQTGVREFDYADEDLTMHIVVEGPAVDALQLEVQVPDAEAYALFSAAREGEEQETDNGDLLLLRNLCLLRGDVPQDLEQYHITAEVTVSASALEPLTQETALLRAQAAPETELGVVLSAPDGATETALLLPGENQIPSLMLEVDQGIVAVQAGTYPNPSYTVQYYANIPRFSDNGAKTWTIYDTSGGVLPSNDGANRTRELYLNATGAQTGKNAGDATAIYRVATTATLTQMYSDNRFTYVNAPNTAYVDKLIDSESYVLDQVWVLKQGKSADSTVEADWDIYLDPSRIHFTSRPERAGENVILITDETCLRLVYNCREAAFTTPSTFYDYDISSGQNSAGLWRTGTTGINSESNYAASRNGQRTWRSYRDVLAVGNANCGTGMGAYIYDGIYLNQFSGRNSGCAFGLAESLSGGQIVYNPWIAAPRLFNEGDALGKHIYSGSSLTFQRIGDTYTLDSASVNGVGYVDGLQDFFNPSPASGTIHGNILTNDFWPLDGAINKTDPSFGATGQGIPYQGFTNAPGTWQENRSTFPVSDDGRAHNCFFGLQYAVSFTLTEDYIGPLEYCFFGDDDMWVFLDNRLVCDIGGVHSAVGEYVNLWDYLTPGQPGPHTLTFFYTERGASGSTCYMNFTLPSVTGVNIEQKTTQLRVQKNVQGRHDASTEFAFHIRFLDARGEGVQDDYAYNRYSADGKPLETDLIICDGSDFSLRGGEYLVIRHLPYGLRYQITEITTEGYSVTNTVNGVLLPGAEAEGTVAQNGNNTVEFTNTRNTFAFSLQKQDPDGTALTGAEFTLTDSGGSPVLALDAGNGSFRVPETDEETGSVARFQVNASGILSISGLQPGSYTLRETAPPAGCIAMMEDIRLTIGLNGEISLSENSLVSCTGSVITVKNEYAPRVLTLEKKVLNANTTGKFDFLLSYPGEDGQPVTHTLSLANGEKSAVSIPYGVNVTIREAEHNGFALTFRNGETILESGPDDSFTFRILEDVTITAVNTAGYVLPDTGGGGEAVFAVTGTMLLAAALIICPRKRRDGKQF